MYSMNLSTARARSLRFEASSLPKVCIQYELVAYTTYIILSTYIQYDILCIATLVLGVLASSSIHTLARVYIYIIISYIIITTTSSTSSMLSCRRRPQQSPDRATCNRDTPIPLSAYIYLFLFVQEPSTDGPPPCPPTRKCPTPRRPLRRTTGSP